MTHSDDTFAFVAVYADLDRAKDDFEAVQDLAAAHEVHLHDAAIVVHRQGGEVEVVQRDEGSARHGLEGGVIVGALAGLLFPPVLPAMLIGAAAGGGFAALIGHLWRGFGRTDLVHLGEAVEEGEAALVAIGTSAYLDDLERALQHATRTVRKAIDVDPDALRAAALGRDG